MPSSKRSRRSTNRRIEPSLVVAVVVAAGLLAGAVWYLTTDNEAAPDAPVTPTETTAGTEPAEASFEEALAATTEAGDMAVEVELEARMPESLDDGVPVRKITGSGSMTGELDVAKVVYGVSKIPNSAGFFGHVDGDLDVVYTQDDMLITFEILPGVLPAPARWVAYDLEYLSSDLALENGIGQLRELALSDPRLALALLSGSAAPADPAGEEDADGVTATKYETEARTDQAAEASPELAATLDEMRENLRIQRVPMTVWLDEDQLVRKLEYELVYPAKNGPGKVRLDVSMALDGFGASVAPEAPDENEIVVYEDYLPTFYTDDES